MQNRLNAVKENEANHRAQLAELHTSIEAEKAARPDSVGFFSRGTLFRQYTDMRYYCRMNARPR